MWQKLYDELKDRLIELGYLQADAEEEEQEEEILAEEPDESVSPLGAALIQALQEARENPSELIEKASE